MSTSFQLSVPADLWNRMVLHAKLELPNECCGLLAGHVQNGVGRASHLYPLVNAAASPTEYLSEAHSLLAAFKDMRRQAIEIMAVYHSHPVSPPLPSRTDLERNYYEDAVHVIISLAGDEPNLRGWWLRGGEVHEASIQISDESNETLGDR